MFSFNTLSNDHTNNATVGPFKCHDIWFRGIGSLYEVFARRKRLTIQDELKGHMHRKSMPALGIDTYHRRNEREEKNNSSNRLL
jgi:hypothetical protein